MSPPASCTANGPVVDSGRDFENEDQIEERSDENEDSICEATVLSDDGSDGTVDLTCTVMEEDTVPIAEIAIDEPSGVSSPTTGASSEGCTTDADSVHLGLCGGCKKPCGPIHRCPGCNVNMHPWCGKPIGEEGYGQAI